MYENILSNMLGCQTYCISDSPSNRYCLIGPIECNEKLTEVFWSIKFNGPLYERTKQSIRLCFGISPLLDVVLVQY